MNEKNQSEKPLMSMNTFLFLCALIFFGCNTDVIEYEVRDDYVGPCVVFVSLNNKVEIKSNTVILNDGLGMINHSDMKKKFIFKSRQSRVELEVIQIGMEKNITDSIRYIFRLTKGATTSSCIKDELRIVSFFVGKKSDYIKWSDKYYSELVFFDSIGIDWCKYYKTHN
jgi:hypothetical protein